MSFHTERLGGHMAAGGQRDRPQPAAGSATQAALIDALHVNLVLCIRGQKLAPPCLSRRDGAVRHANAAHAARATPECAEVNIISSEDRDKLGDGRKMVNGANWHTDDSFMREPCSLTMLYGVVVPSRGGDTQFTNMYAAYETCRPRRSGASTALR